MKQKVYIDTKEFDAVKMMRQIRQKHHEEYKLNPELREKRLAAIRSKYANRIKTSKIYGIYQ
jgi:hypothetical protein